MLEIVKLIFSVLIQVITFAYIVKQLCEKKFDFNKLSNYIILLIMTILMFLLWKYVFNASKILFMYSLVVFGFKYVFNISFHESVITNFIAILIGNIFEILFSIFVVYIIKLPTDIIIKYFQMTPISGILMFLFAYIFLKYLKSYIIKIKETLSSKNILYMIYFIGIIGSALILSKNINNWKNNKDFLSNISSAIIFIFMLFFLIKEKIKMYKLTSDYDNLVAYLGGTETLLEKYQKYNHENKNQLLVVKGLCKNNHKITQYINSILDDDIEHQNKWIKELKYIPNGGLKGLVSYKINNMIDNGIKISVSISPKIKNLNFKNINPSNYKNICRIIGVFIDNSYEASKESKKKEVLIESFLDEDKIIVIISNSYKGKINIKELDKLGYTTKGRGRGVGLSLVKEIIEQSTILEQKREIINDYYYQYLYIKLK